jgi:hypothetical protein
LIRTRHIPEPATASRASASDKSRLERFPAKWIAVRVKKTRQNKEIGVQWC